MKMVLSGLEVYEILAGRIVDRYAMIAPILRLKTVERGYNEQVYVLSSGAGDARFTSVERPEPGAGEEMSVRLGC